MLTTASFQALPNIARDEVGYDSAYWRPFLLDPPGSHRRGCGKILSPGGGVYFWPVSPANVAIAGIKGS